MTDSNEPVLHLISIIFRMDEAREREECKRRIHEEVTRADPPRASSSSPVR